MGIEPQCCVVTKYELGLPLRLRLHYWVAARDILCLGSKQIRLEVLVVCDERDWALNLEMRLRCGVLVRVEILHQLIMFLLGQEDLLSSFLLHLDDLRLNILGYFLERV